MLPPKAEPRALNAAAPVFAARDQIARRWDEALGRLKRFVEESPGEGDLPRPCA
jgi:hypothetical protein